jgi:hypothetical protein
LAYEIVRLRPSGYAGHASLSAFARLRHAKPPGGAWWTERARLTINRRSLKLLRWLHGNAQVAQLVEHATENRSVGGSIPPLGTISGEGAQLAFVVERPQPLI